jgi:hypothetical protein
LENRTSGVANPSPKLLKRVCNSKISLKINLYIKKSILCKINYLSSIKHIYINRKNFLIYIKKTKLFFFSLLLISTVLVYTSCSKDEKTPPSGYLVVWRNSTLPSGMYYITLDLTKGDNNIQKVVLTNNDTILTDYYGYKWDGGTSAKSRGYYNSSNSTISDTTKIKMPSTSGSYSVTMTVYDTDGLTATDTYKMSY